MLEGASLGGTVFGAATAVGAAAVLTGLLMLIRRDPLSRAVGIFAIGAVLVALPLLAPAPPSDPAAPLPAPVAIGEGIVVSTGGGLTVALPAPKPPPPLPGREAAIVSIEAQEAEPNDSVAAANRAPLGVAIDGTVAPGDRDYFRVAIPDRAHGAIVASVLVMDGDVTLALLDDAGQTLGLMTTRKELRVRTVTLERKLDRPAYTIAILAESNAPVAYQLTIAARPR